MVLEEGDASPFDVDKPDRLGLLKEGSESARPPSSALIPPTSQKVNSPRVISSMAHANYFGKLLVLVLTNLRWYGDHNIRWRCIEIHCPGSEDVLGKIARSD